MTFAWPLALAGLVLVPIVVIGYVLADRRRARDAGRFANPDLLPNLLPVAPGRRRHVPAAIALVALVVLLVALARPHATVSVPREQATVVLALDTSRSMAATDVVPSRLEAARKASAAFLEKVPKSYRVAIVAFSTKAEVVLQPTNNHDAALTSLSELRLGSGTAIGDAIMTSLGAVKQPTQAEQRKGVDPTPVSILLLSDGAQTGGRTQPLAAARRAHNLRIPIYTVALGTRDAIVEVPRPGGLKERVTVTPDAATLRRIAQTADGRFFAAPNDEQLTSVFRDLGSRLGHERKRQEVTYAFALGGAGLLLAGGALSALWFRRPL